MFKDARLQERLLDQIHAGEFNLEDDFRTAEVGSLMSSVDYRDGGFQRIDDGEAVEPGQVTPPRTREPVAAHIEGFVDNVDETPLRGGGFQRVSDEDDAQSNTAASPTVADDSAQEEVEKPARGRATSKKSRLGKLLNSVSGKKKAASKRPAKKSAKQVAE